MYDRMYVNFLAEKNIYIYRKYVYTNKLAKYEQDCFMLFSCPTLIEQNIWDLLYPIEHTCTQAITDTHTHVTHVTNLYTQRMKFAAPFGTSLGVVSVIGRHERQQVL